MILMRLLVRAPHSNAQSGSSFAPAETTPNKHITINSIKDCSNGHGLTKTQIEIPPGQNPNKTFKFTWKT